MRNKKKTLADELSGKRVGVVLSAGYFGFYSHAGFVRALERCQVAPAAYSGSSAGAVIAAFAAAGMGGDEIAAVLQRVRRSDFWDPIGLRQLWRNDLPALGLLRGERLRRLFERLLPVQLIEQCPAELFVEATNLSAGRTEVLSEGDLPLALCASCAYPGLFLPVRLGDDVYWDGGLVNKVPIAPLVDRVDAVVVHWLQSGELQRPLNHRAGLFNQFKTLTRGMAIGRQQNSWLSVRLAVARGTPVYLVSPDAPSVDPFHLDRGQKALDVAQKHAEEVLSQPANWVRIPRDSS